MNGSLQLKEPIACSEAERSQFALLVRQGFEGSDAGLVDRIRDAKRLAFYYASGSLLAAIAALKAPSERYRDDVFEKAHACANPADYTCELGWVFVVGVHRGNRIAGRLCQRLLAGVGSCGVLATTRSNNTSMIRMLRALDFARVGVPYPRGGEELVLFLRSPTSS